MNVIVITEFVDVTPQVRPPLMEKCFVNESKPGRELRLVLFHHLVEFACRHSFALRHFVVVDAWFMVIVQVEKNSEELHVVA